MGITNILSSNNHLLTQGSAKNLLLARIPKISLVLISMLWSLWYPKYIDIWLTPILMIIDYIETDANSTTQHTEYRLYVVMLNFTKLINTSCYKQATIFTQSCWYSGDFTNLCVGNFKFSQNLVQNCWFLLMAYFWASKLYLHQSICNQLS